MDLVLITGKVRISEDTEGRLLAVNLRADDGRNFHVFLDTQGELLGLDMAGFRAEVHAQLQEQTDGTWLRVVGFEEAAGGSPPDNDDPDDNGRDLQPALVSDKTLADDDDIDEDEDEDEDEDDEDDRG